MKAMYGCVLWRCWMCESKRGGCRVDISCRKGEAGGSTWASLYSQGPRWAWSAVDLTSSDSETVGGSSHYTNSHRMYTFCCGHRQQSHQDWKKGEQRQNAKTCWKKVNMHHDFPCLSHLKGLTGWEVMHTSTTRAARDSMLCWRTLQQDE